MIDKKNLKEIDTTKHKTELLAFKDKPSDLLDALLAIKVEAPSDVFEDFFVAFLTENNLDIIKIAKEGLDKGSDVFRVAYLIGNSLDRFPEFNAEELAELLILFASKMKHDLAGGMFYTHIRNLGKAKPAIAEKIANYLLTKKKEETYGYLSSSFLGIADNSFQAGFLKISFLLENADPNLVSTGIRSLGLLGQIPDDNKAKILEVLNKSSVSTELMILDSVAFSCLRLTERYPELINTVLTLSQSPVPDIKYEIASFLNTEKKPYTDWQQKCLINIIGYDLKYEVITRSIGFIFFHLVKTGQHELFIQLIGKWISSYTMAEHQNIRLEKLFEGAFFEMTKARPLLNRISFLWANNNDNRFHHCLGEITSYLQPRNCPSPEFESADLEGLNIDDYIFIIRKIFAYIFNFEYAAALIFSLLKGSLNENQIVSLVSSAFVNNLGDNYPEKTIEFLENKSKISGLNDVEKKVCEKASVELKSKVEALKNLSVIPELYPKLEDHLAVAREFRKSLSSSMAEAQKDSPIIGLFKQVLISAGRGSFHYQHGKYSEVSHMTHFSQPLNLPKKEVIDIVGATLERSGFRMAKRGDK